MYAQQNLNVMENSSKIQNQSLRVKRVFIISRSYKTKKTIGTQGAVGKK